MSDLTLEQALENIYDSLGNNNQDIDAHIAALKNLLVASGTSSVEVDATKLAQNNRQGRKTLQSYFKKRGVEVTFAKIAA